jgi:hypothetical protein
MFLRRFLHPLLIGCVLPDVQQRRLAFFQLSELGRIWTDKQLRVEIRQPEPCRTVSALLSGHWQPQKQLHQGLHQPLSAYAVSLCLATWPLAASETAPSRPVSVSVSLWGKPVLAYLVTGSLRNSSIKAYISLCGKSVLATWPLAASETAPSRPISAYAVSLCLATWPLAASETAPSRPISASASLCSAVSPS